MLTMLSTSYFNLRYNDGLFLLNEKCIYICLESKLIEHTAFFGLIANEMSFETQIKNSKPILRTYIYTYLLSVHI